MKAFLKVVLPGVAAVGLASLVGCAHTDPYESHTQTYHSESEQPPPPPPAVAKTPSGICKSSMAIPTGDRGSSSVLVERSAPCEVVVGQQYCYDLLVTNLTNLELNDVQVTDQLAPGFKMSSADPKGTIDKNNLASWELGTIWAKGTRNIRVCGSATLGANVSYCAGVSYNNSVCQVTNVVQPMLKLVLAAPAEATSCDTIQMKLDVTNTGTGEARNVKVRQTLPTGLTADDGKSALMFDAGSLSAGQTKSFTFNAKAGQTGRYANKAVAAADYGLTAESTELLTNVRRPVLMISNTCPEKMYAGRTLNSEIVVLNKGDAPAVDTTIETPIPSSLSFTRASEGGMMKGGMVTWNLGTLAPGASKKVTMTLNAPNIGSTETTATARAACAEPVSAVCETQAEGIPALLLEGYDRPDPVEVGDVVTYFLTVTNQGSVAATKVRLVCTMDADDSMTYVSSEGPTTANVAGHTIAFQPLASLAPQEKAQYKIVVRAAKEGQVSFKAESSSAEITRPLIKVETTNFFK